MFQNLLQFARLLTGVGKVSPMYVPQARVYGFGRKQRIVLLVDPPKEFGDVLYSPDGKNYLPQWTSTFTPEPMDYPVDYRLELADPTRACNWHLDVRGDQLMEWNGEPLKLIKRGFDPAAVKVMQPRVFKPGYRNDNQLVPYYLGQIHSMPGSTYVCLAMMPGQGLESQYCLYVGNDILEPHVVQKVIEEQRLPNIAYSTHFVTKVGVLSIVQHQPQRDAGEVMASWNRKMVFNRFAIMVPEWGMSSRHVDGRERLLVRRPDGGLWVTMSLDDQPGENREG